MQYLLGLDIGTTSTIGALIDDEGNIVALKSQPVELHCDHANWSEEDPEQWWQNCGEICQALLRESGVSPELIKGVGVSGMVPAVVLVDENGHALRRSIQQNDARATSQLDYFRERMSEAEFLALAGCGYSQQLVGPKLRWLRENEPAIFDRAKYVMGASDFITMRLCGQAQVEHNWPLEAGFLSISTGKYNEKLIDLAGISRNLLPPVRQSHEVVGAITEAAARHTGLNAGTAVVAGCADHVASAFVCGAVNNGDLVLKFGGAGDILLSSDLPVSDPHLFLDYHIVPELFFSNGCMASSGSFLNWIVANWAGAEKLKADADGMSAHSWLDRAASELDSKNPILFLPYFLGEKTPINDPLARGTLVGVGLNHDIRHIWRAALEGVVFGFRHHIEVFESIGLKPGRIFASDGGAVSDLWLQIAANAIGRSVTRIEQHPGSSLGAAFVAGMGVGVFRDWSEISKYVQLGRQFNPNEDAHAALSAKYLIWRDIYCRLRPVYRDLSKTME